MCGPLLLGIGIIIESGLAFAVTASQSFCSNIRRTVFHYGYVALLHLVVVNIVDGPTFF